MNMLRKAPFYGLLAMRWNLEPDTKTPDVWINGQTLGYNPTWASDCSFDEMMSAIAHAAHHVALLHHLRRNGRDETQWNQASDVPVFAALRQGDFALPKGVCVKPGDELKSAEEIYSGMNQRQQPRPQPQPKPGDGQSADSNDQGKPRKSPGAGVHGEVRDQPSKTGNAEMDPAEKQEAISDAMEMIAAAAQQAKSQTSGAGVPAAIIRQIEELLYPLEDWRTLLRDYLTGIARSDYTWTKPNRRFIASGMYLPALWTQCELGNIVIAVDTSGSMDSRKLQLVGGGLSEIFEEFGFEKISVLYCDVKVHRVDEFNPGESFSFNAVGEGDTDFRPIFKRIADDDIRPDLLICFTDMGGRPPAIQPEYPVMWLDQTGDRNNPYVERFGPFPGIVVPMRG
jgi:predicted metal-dependent peptidase